MERKQIVDFLADITTHLGEVSPKEKKRVEELQKSLAQVFLTQDLPIKRIESELVAKQSASVETIDKERIKNIVAQAKPLKGDDQMHVEMRTSDFKTDLFRLAKQEGILKNVIPSYTAVRKIKTEGPFVGVGGMDLSFDFFPFLTKLNSLYIEGQALPALLFKTRTFKFPIELPGTILLPFKKGSEVLSDKREVGRISKRKENILRKGAKDKLPAKEIITPDKIHIKTAKDILDQLPKNTRLYQIAGNTVWIRANLLSPSAPDGHYCPLRVKNGTVFLNKLPISEVKNKITVSATTTTTVNLDLDQWNIDAGSDGIFGLDAKNATYQLPENFSFRIKNTQKTILTVSDINCKVYGEDYSLKYKNSQNVGYNDTISSVTLPMKSNKSEFSILDCQSSLVDVSEKAVIKNTFWMLLSMPIDIQKPLEAGGNGALVFECNKGLTTNIKNTDETLSLSAPSIYLLPQIILMLDQKSNGEGLQREVNLWKDESKPFGTTAEIKYRKESGFFYTSEGQGEENLMLFADVHLKVDRPVKVDGDPVSINAKQSILGFKGKDSTRGLAIIDFDLIKDNYIPPTPNQPEPQTIKPIAFALQNALFTVTPPMAFSLSGKYDEDFQNIFEAELLTAFGVFRYIPTLPDPYAANIGIFNRNNPRDKGNTFRLENIILSMNNITTWKKDEEVSTDFEFRVPNSPQKYLKGGEERAESPNGENIVQEFGSEKFVAPSQESSWTRKEGNVFQAMSQVNDLAKNPNETRLQISEILANLMSENWFTLLDVSSNANQLGVNFKPYKRSIRLADNGGNDGQWAFPLKIDKLDVVSQGINAQAFMLPQISWEPTFNLSEQIVTDGTTMANDPPQGFNYYPNDGIATYIGNYGKDSVPLAPIPISQYLERVYTDENNRITYAIFNLPFGKVGLTLLDNGSEQVKKPTIKNVSPEFNESMEGGIQLELTAGSSFAAEGDLFQGVTVQLANVQDMTGQQDDYSTLGSSVHEIFSGEFSEMPSNPNDRTRPAVPLERIGLSGYGASTFSDWHNKNAAFAATSQATFNVATGRTMQEVVQVKSVIYPWGIFVVRTITILRLSSGYIIRLDSGWQAESDGKFYYGVEREGILEKNPYEYHAGLVNGLYNIRNIRENELTHKDTTTITKGDFVFNPETNKEEEYTKLTDETGILVLLRGLTFDADIEIEGVIEGQDKNNRVPSKGVLGFVQLRPRGAPIKKKALWNLLDKQNGSIGGPVNCTIKIANTEQYMKINRVDVNNSQNEGGTPVFVAAARGSVVLPKEGSWTMVSHKASDGTVTPLDADMSVPLIRSGRWDFGELENPLDLNNLQRIAHPIELIRNPSDLTINFGFLQNLDTQKVLFLSPAFKKGVHALLSKTPPLMADGYRLLNSKGIFPNIGDAVNGYGEAVQLLKGKVKPGEIKDLFEKVSSGADAGIKDVYKVLGIASEIDAGKLVDQGYQLLKKGVGDGVNKALNFDFPAGDYPLIKTADFKIIIKYQADNKSKLDYNLDSFANDFEDQWRGRLNNISMVVSLGPFDDLMIVKGNFNNEKGKESNFGGKVTAEEGTLPTPKIEFSNAIEPVIQILEILQKLSTEDYAGALNKGLQVAMSNSANIWEYKYEANKEIGLIRFPPGPAYDSPQVPLKLEASLSLGFYFNAALKVTDDPKGLLPTAGAFFIFHGGLQVMCVSVGGATIFAIGNVDLKLSADTKPSLAVDMKFGFGAQLAVGLPVIGNVSIQFMISVEIHADTGNNVSVAAIMMFRGHAELCGGLVGVTITIEAKGAVEKSGNGPTNCRASVSFGLDISVAFIINISFHESWEETKQIA